VPAIPKHHHQVEPGDHHFEATVGGSWTWTESRRNFAGPYGCFEEARGRIQEAI